VLKSWRDKWENLSAYFRYHDDIRRIIYTTNAVEAVHRQFRKLTKTKGAFPNETSLLKLIFPLETASTQASRMPKRNGPCPSRTGT
jgi:putative transposase